MFNLADYETVEERLVKFWKENPDGQIHTKLLSNTPTQFIVEASIYRTEADARPWTTGLAEETIAARGVNATSALENCETSAIGRALANAGFATTGKRASREEMSKVAGAEKVKSEIADVKAKMAETSKQYIPVPVEDDVWTTHPTEAPKTSEEAVNLVKSIIGGQTEKDIPKCRKCDVPKIMMWKTGVSGKTNKSWGKFDCFACKDLMWYEIKPDGSWGAQESRF